MNKQLHNSMILVAFFAAVLCAPVRAVNTGELAPDFLLPALPAGQGEVALSELRDKVVYLDFWASWCGPCRLSLPALDRIHSELAAQGLEVVAVNVDEVQSEALAFLEKYPVGYRVVADPAGRTPEQYGVLGMPTAFLIDRQGVVRGVHAGFRKSDETAVRAALLELLAE